MGSISRKLKRQQAKNNGTFIYKKSLAKKFGCSVAELNKRLERREKNLRELEGITDGTGK